MQRFTLSNLVASLLFCAAALQGQAGEEAAGSPAITVAADQAAPRLERGELVAIDVRPAAAFRQGHLPGALQLEAMPAKDLGGVADWQRELGRQGLTGRESLLLYGDASSGEPIATLFWQLEWAGAHEVLILDGGIDRWKQGGHPLVRTEKRRAAQAFTAAARDQAVADVSWVNDHFGLAGVEVLDLRDPGVWMAEEKGYAAPPQFTAGHIPQSLPYDFRAWLPQDGRWPDPEAVRAVLSKLGPRPYTPVDLKAELILYGTGPEDPSLGLGYLTLRRLGIRARVFADGFAAWSRNPANPVVHIVGPEEVRALLEKENPGLAADRPPRSAAVLDLREEEAFRLGHLPGALNLPAYDHFLPAFQAAQKERWPGIDPVEFPVIVYCYGRECIRSRNGCTELARLGFSRLLWLRDGIDVWTRDGLPLLPPPPPAKAPTPPT